jgi:hypothetical protein
VAPAAPGRGPETARGFRIEIDGITAVLRRHPSVRDAAVVVLPVNRPRLRIAFPLRARPGVRGQCTAALLQ